MTVKCFGELEATTIRPLWSDQKANTSMEAPYSVLSRGLVSLQGLQHACCSHGQ